MTSIHFFCYSISSTPINICLRILIYFYHCRSFFITNLVSAYIISSIFIYTLSFCFYL